MPAQERILVLIHGIRTRAAWQERLEEQLPAGTFSKVYRIKYGRFDTFRFWLPPPFRSAPVERLLRELTLVRNKHPAAEIVVLAHSYGTYALGKILLRHPLELNTVILAASILPEAFPWDRIEATVSKVINECGLQDIWPVLAKTTTIGYGASGVFGFGSVSAEDRYFALDHSGFFRPHFIERYWMPLLVEGRVRKSGAQKNRYYEPTVRVLGALPTGSFLWFGGLLALTIAALFDHIVALPEVLGISAGDWSVPLAILTSVAAIVLLAYAARSGWQGKHYEMKKVAPGELRDVIDLSSTFFDEVPSRETIRSIYKTNGRVLFFVDKVTRGAGTQTRTHIGCFSILPLKEQAVSLLESEELDGLQMTSRHIATPHERARALYIGSVAVRGMLAQGQVLNYIQARIDTEVDRGVEHVFARPITKRGLQLVEGYGFEPVGGEDEGGLGRVYRRSYLG